MLIDTELSRLNALVQDALSAGRTPTEALEPLTEELHRLSCTGEDFAFSNGRSPKGLDHHVMLCSSTAIWQRAATMYRSLSGAGAHYNGMFGDGKMLRDDVAAQQLTVKDRPAAPIAEQVAICLRILGCGQASLMPELAEATRRHLSGILLEYPVLMHPAFLLPVAQPNTEYTAIAWALARTPHGGLPRYSHFSHFKSCDNMGVDHVLLKRLTDFAKHPCVRVAMTRLAYRVTCNVDGKTARDREVKIKTETLVRALLSRTGPHVQFLGSVMELDELISPAGANVTPPRPFSTFASKDPSVREQLDPMLAASLVAASGLIHTAVVLGTIPDSMRTYEVDPHFVAGIRARAPVLFGLGPVDSGFGRALASSAQRRVFLGRQDDLGAWDVEQNTQRLVRGLVDCGFVHTSEEAASFVRQSTIGRDRPNATLPHADTTGAIAFLKAIEKTGGFGATDVQVLAALQTTHDDVAKWPEYNVPFRDAWAKALEVMQVERAMMSVLNRVAASALNAATAPAAAPANGGAETEMAPMRRRRAAV